MNRLNNQQRALLGAGAVASLFWACWNLRNLFVFIDAGSGGLGAVSVGFSEDLLVYPIPILVNLVLTRWTRRRGRTAVRWRWAHPLTTLAFAGATVTAAVMLGASLSAGSQGFSGAAVTVLFAVSALALPVQLFATGFVAFVMAETRPNSR